MDLRAHARLTAQYNHQTRHRGQLTALLHQIGIDPGITDLPWLPSPSPSAGEVPTHRASEDGACPSR